VLAAIGFPSSQALFYPFFLCLSREERSVLFDGILFDLDGTLWDAVPEITESWNQGILQCGVVRAPLTVEELRPCMGMLLPDIGAQLLPELSVQRRMEVMDRCCEVECDYLAQHGAGLCPGVAEALESLFGHFPLLVVSNCQDGYIQAFFQGTGLGKYFQDFECAGRTGLPKSENIRLAARRNALKRPVYVGDTALDAASARQANVAFVHASYGFGSVANVPAVKRLDELPALLEQMCIASSCEVEHFPV